MPSLASLRDLVAAALAIPSVLLGVVGALGCLCATIGALAGYVMPADILSNLVVYLVLGVSGVLVSAIVSEV